MTESLLSMIDVPDAISVAVGDDAIKRHYYGDEVTLPVNEYRAPTYLEDFGTSEFGPAGGTDHAVRV